MKSINNEKGVALITVLLFGLVSFGVVTGAYFMVTSGTRMSGMEKRYISELDVAKGVSDYIMVSMIRGNLTCNGSASGSTLFPTCTGDDTCTTAASSINIDGGICNALGKGINCDNITACFISETNKTEIDVATGDSIDITIVSINVNSIRPSGEQANIDFVMRLE